MTARAPTRSRHVTLAMNEPIGVDRHRSARTRRRCSASSRWSCRRIAMGNPVVAVPSPRSAARGDRPLPGARHLRRARRRRQHRHRRPRRAGEDPRRARRRRRALVLRRRRRRGGGREASAGNLKQTWTRRQRVDWLSDREAQGASSCASDPGEEHLGALRRVTRQAAAGSGARPDEEGLGQAAG